MQNNSHKVALVTGAARRIGAEIARCLHAAGYNIVLHYYLSQTEAEQLALHLNQIRKNSVKILHADLLMTDSIDALAVAAQAAWGRLDVLVNNASKFYKTTVGKTTEFEWDDLLNSNLKATYFLCQAALPALAVQNGCIINIADIHADKPMLDYSVYCIAKAGIVMLTKTLARELGPAVRVNAVAPSSILSPEGQNQLSPDQQQKIIDRTALKREGKAEDIAKAVLFLARDADYMTGQVLAIDGGRSLFTT